MTEIATTYGQALYDLASAEGLSQEILQQLDALNSSFSQEPGFVDLLCNPVLSKQERCQVLDDSLRAQVHLYVLNFLKILTEKGYMRHFSGCCQLYRQQYNHDNGILPVTAVSAMPLSDELRRKLIEKLSERTGKTIELTCRIDSACLGGVRLELDGMQVDGTVRHRLDELHGVLQNTVL